jgi:hypothetical protein
LALDRHAPKAQKAFMPLAMLSLWTLLFSWLMHAREYRSSPV